MRFVVELTDGVSSQVGLSGLAGGGSGPTSFTQALTQVKDILQATSFEVGVHLYSVTTNASTLALGPLLYLETSMQNEDSANALWQPVAVGAGSSLNLYTLSQGTVPMQTIWTVDADFGRYLRWRIEIPGNTTAITLTAIFKISLLGHG